MKTRKLQVRTITASGVDTPTPHDIVDYLYGKPVAFTREVVGLLIAACGAPAIEAIRAGLDDRLKWEPPK